jgi:Tfp pilus assembly protein PilO
MKPQFSRYYTYIRPILKNKTVKTYSSLVFSLFMVVIFSLFAIKPTITTIVALQKSIDEQEKLLEQIQKKGQDLEVGKRNYDQIDSDIKLTLLGLIPNSTSIPSLIDSLSSLAASFDASMSGVQIQPVDLDGPPDRLTKQAALKEIDFTLSVQGSYIQLTDFLDALYRIDRLINIQTVSFSKQIDGRLTMTVNARANYVKNE